MTTATVLASCVDASVDCHDTSSVDLLPLLVVVALVVVVLVTLGIALLGRQRRRRRSDPKHEQTKAPADPAGAFVCSVSCR